MTQSNHELSIDWSEAMMPALRSYRRGALSEAGRLVGSLLLQRELPAEKSNEDEQARLWALRRVLESALEELQQRDGEMAALLQRRFFQGEAVLATAQALNISESSIYYRQKQAIQLLADLLQTRENSLRQTQTEARQQRSHHLPPPTYYQLFGLEDKLNTLRTHLRNRNAPWLITLVGLGGMGKTTLAHALATWATQENLFPHLVWLAAKEENHTTWQQGESAANGHNGFRQNQVLPAIPGKSVTGQSTTLTQNTLLAAITSQLGLTEITPLPGQDTQPNQEMQQRKIDQLRTFLNGQPALIVVDNLETVTDYSSLVEIARHLVQPSKLIITSRYVIDTPAALVVRMDELAWSDSLALLRFEAGLRGLSELVAAPAEMLQPIYEVVGGNPLALKLVVGQLTTLPYSEVMNRLRHAHKSRDKAEYELYHNLYWQTWQLLSPPARELLLTMPVLPMRGASWDDLLQTSGLPHPQMSTALTELVNRSLINAGGWPEKVYSIHRLTHTFLMTEVLKWW